jgi:hypothetical protein
MHSRELEPNKLDQMTSHLESLDITVLDSIVGGDANATAIADAATNRNPYWESCLDRFGADGRARVVQCIQDNTNKLHQQVLDRVNKLKP